MTPQFDSFAHFRKDGALFAVWLDGNRPVLVAGPLPNPDPTRPPTDYVAAKAAEVGGRDFTGYERVGGVWMCQWRAPKLKTSPDVGMMDHPAWRGEPHVKQARDEKESLAMDGLGLRVYKTSGHRPGSRPVPHAWRRGDGRLMIFDGTTNREWNPLENEADARELAEKAGVEIPPKFEGKPQDLIEHVKAVIRARPAPEAKPQ